MRLLIKLKGVWAWESLLIDGIVSFGSTFVQSVPWNSQILSLQDCLTYHHHHAWQRFIRSPIWRCLWDSSQLKIKLRSCHWIASSLEHTQFPGCCNHGTVGKHSSFSYSYLLTQQQHTSRQGFMRMYLPSAVAPSVTSRKSNHQWAWESPVYHPSLISDIHLTFDRLWAIVLGSIKHGHKWAQYSYTHHLIPDQYGYINDPQYSK